MERNIHTLYYHCTYTHNALGLSELEGAVHRSHQPCNMRWISIGYISICGHSLQKCHSSSPVSFGSNSSLLFFLVLLLDHNSTIKYHANALHISTWPAWPWSSIREVVIVYIDVVCRRIMYTSKKHT